MKIVFINDIMLDTLFGMDDGEEKWYSAMTPSEKREANKLFRPNRNDIQVQQVILAKWLHKTFHEGEFSQCGHLPCKMAQSATPAQAQDLVEDPPSA